MLDSTLTTTEQLQILLDCIYANTGKEALLNGSQTKSTRNFHFIRSERTPSCSLFVKNGTPFIHDFGAGITYNYISAYAAAYNLSNNEAFKELMARYRPDEQSPARPQPPARRYQPPVLEVPAPDEVEEEPTDIEVSTELHPFEKAYFENLGIAPALLAQYHIYGLRAYKKLSSTEGNPVFAIRVGEGGYKIYQPQARDKAFKWFFVGKKPEGFNIYGLEQLSDRSGDLFITEGLKDTLSILAHTPYESIALDNAAIRPSAELIYALKARYQRLVLCFDLDDTGTQKARALAREWGLSVVSLPEVLRTRHRGKDVTDFFRHFSREDFDRLPIESFTPRHILVTEYLTEPGPEQQLFQIFRQNPGTLLLPAPTGSGKNELVNRFISQELPKSREVRFFNGFPNNITAEAKTKEYAHPENNYSGLGLPIGLMDQYTDPIERKYLDYFQVINFVYNSYGQIEPLVSENDYMFLDEIHKWITQGSIAPVETINKILKCPARKVLMTGTPFESFVQEFNLHPLLVERSINPEVTVRCVELIRHQKSSFNAKGRQKLYRLATANLIDCLNAKEKKLHLIYLNDKQGIDYVAQRARKKGFEVELIYSDEEVKKNSQAWQCLTTSQPIPLKENQAKIVLLTSLGYDSLNLNNPEEEIGVFAVMGEKYLENLRQAIKRPRKAGKLEVLYFLAAHKHRNPFTESYDSHRQKWYSDFLKISARLSKYKPIELLRMPNSARHKLLNDVSGVITDDLEFNQLGCVIAYEQRQANQQTNAQKFDQLKKYYAVETRQLCVSKLIRLFTPAPDDPSAPPGDDDKYSSLTTQNEEDMISDSELMEEQNLHSARQVKNLLRSNVYYVLAYLYEDRRIGVRTKERIKDLLGGFYFKDLDYLYFKDSIQIDRNAYKFLMEYVFRILYLAQYFEISPEMLDMVFSGRYPAIHQQIETALVLENKDPQAHRLINQAVYRQVVDAFNVGESYSRAEQTEKIAKIYQAFEHTHFSPEDHCKLFRALFVTQEDRRDKNTRRKRIKKVISLRAVMAKHSLRPKTDVLAVAVL